MRLFTVNELHEVELNKPWIALIPEFQAIIKRDKGSPGDYRGDKKLKAKRELAYIYFCLDFTSPLREWDEEARKLEALTYTDLKKEDVDGDAELQAAYDKYEELLLLSSRSLKTLKALQKGMDTLDKYFENVNFDAVDKLGKIKYTPDAYIANVTKLPKMRAAVSEYEKQVEEELRADSGIRGKATLGGKEGKKRDKLWEEKGAPPDDPDSQDADLRNIDPDEEEEEDDV